MMRLFPALLALALAACSGGARGVDYTPDRGISADIDAALYPHAGSLIPGVTERDVPEGQLPWQLNERHQQYYPY